MAAVAKPVAVSAIVRCAADNMADAASDLADTAMVTAGADYHSGTT